MSTPAVEAMFNYSVQHDEYAEAEQTFRSSLPRLAVEAGAVAGLFLRAYVAEDTDPEPQDSLWCACSVCLRYLSRVG